MHYLKTIILLIIVFLVSQNYGQEIDKNYRKLKYASEYNLVLNNDSIETFYISKNPITNREYLTYLCWLSNVYQSYPEVLLSALPKLKNKYVDSLLNNGFTPIQIKTVVEGTPFYENYMFSPKYIDYPVLGLNWNQSMNFLNWLSDRYNEALLIKKRILEFDPDQLSENSFNTEAYLMDQYDGLVNSLIWDPDTKKLRSVKWKDRVLVPTFRLPSQNELNLAQQSIHNTLKEYRPNKFLAYWTKYYLEIKENKTILRIEYENDLSFSINNNKTIRPEYHEIFGEISEIKLDEKFDRKENSIFKILSDLGLDVIVIKDQEGSISKDSLGHMPFIIIGEDDKLNPIFINRFGNPTFENSDLERKETNYSILRYALCEIKN